MINMLKAYLRVFSNEDSDYPRDTTLSSELPGDVIKERARILDKWGVENIVLTGEDCFQHSEIWDIIDYIEQELIIPTPTVMTRGRWVRTGPVERRDIYSRNMDVIVPIDFFNPFVQGDIIGYSNYTEVDNVMQFFPDVEVHQTLTSDNLQMSLNLAENPHIDWVGHELPYEFGDHYAPEKIATEDNENFGQQMVQKLQQEGKLNPVVYWALIHSRVNECRAYPPFLRDSVMERGKRIAGTFYVDENGMVRTDIRVCQSPDVVGRLQFLEPDDMVGIAQKWNNMREQKQQQQQQTPDIPQL